MSIEEVKCFQIDPNKEPKQIIYEGKHIADADLLRMITKSEYFLENYNFYSEQKEILLPSEPIEITEQAIKNFISIFQVEEFQINESIIFQLYYLSIKYKVQNLTKLIYNYIIANNQKLVIGLLNYKMEIQDLPNYDELNINIDKDDEIRIISSNLINFINNNEFLSLPINILCLIFENYFKDNYFSLEISNFFFNYLLKYKQNAFVLFSYIRFNSIHELIMFENKLIPEYEDTFIFNYLNSKSIIKTHLTDKKSMEKQNQEKDQKIIELEKQNQEKNQKIIELEKLIKEKNKQIQEKNNQIIDLQKQYEKLNQLLLFKEIYQHFIMGRSHTHTRRTP